MQISNEVLLVLERCATEGNKLMLPDQLERSLYQKVNKAIEACGGKWSRKEKAHVFESPAFARIEQVMLTGEVDVPKDDFEYFPTPDAVVKLMLEFSGYLHGKTVLEPSAGQGHIAKACVADGAIVDCIELNRTNYELLAKDKSYRSVLCADFMALPPPVELRYDLAMMNPPFSRQADIHHVNHAMEFLKPGGKLVAVMSSGVTFRENRLTKEFRDRVHANHGEITPLPEKSFKSSGTLVNTVIVTMIA